ncbi:M20/M25/M40 family metallo-hydrolase [soil metagenome]
MRFTWSGAVTAANVLLVGVGVSALEAQTSSSANGGADARSDAAAVIERVITEESYEARLSFLASDALQGRNTPSVGLEVAAEWLRSEHRRMGTAPGAGDDSYFQRWPYRQIRSDREGTTLTLTGPAGSATVSGSAGVPTRGASDDALSAELVFLGIPGGTPAPEAGSLEGKMVVFHAPGPFSQPWLQGLNRANAAAQAGGAQGSIVVVDPDFDDAAIESLVERFDAGAWRMGWDMAPPQVVIRRGVASSVIENFDALATRAEGGEAFRTDLAGTRVTGQVPADVMVDGRPSNVVAILRGSDPALRGEYVVLSAHYDHVGIGTPMDGDSIYNGADDNGSGTVALLEVANALSQLEVGPRRSIAFVHVSGEEKGLLGASWFVDNPPMPVEQMIANINADMIGGDEHRDTLVVIGKNYSTLGPLVDELNDGMPELGLTTSDDIWPDQRFFFRSDQFHFMRKEIPALFFFTGVHECYHRPCDQVDRLNIDKATRVARLLAHATLEIANRDERPQWDPAGLEEVRQLTGGGR